MSVGRSVHGHKERDTSPVPQAAKNQPQIKSSFIKASPKLLLSEREAGFGDDRGTSSLDRRSGWCWESSSAQRRAGVIVKRKHFMF